RWGLNVTRSDAGLNPTASADDRDELDDWRRFHVKAEKVELRTMFEKILHRPALAIVVSIIILFLGGLAIKSLPVSQFPSIAPPTVMVFITYPGASAEVLVDSTLILLERAINGVQDMRYMASSATSAGEATILIYFEPGTDPNIAVVNVQ